MRSKDIRGLGAALLCLLLVSCSNPGNSVKQAEQLADGYYQALINKDFDQAAGFFMDTRAESRAQWLDELKDYHQKLGDLQSYRLVGQTVNTVYSGTRYTLRYKTQYSQGFAHETVILFDGVSTFGGEQGNILKIESLIVRPERK